MGPFKKYVSLEGGVPKKAQEIVQGDGAIQRMHVQSCNFHKVSPCKMS